MRCKINVHAPLYSHSLQQVTADINTQELDEQIKAIMTVSVCIKAAYCYVYMVECVPLLQFFHPA